jgi:hypothetical protein
MSKSKRAILITLAAATTVSGLASAAALYLGIDIPTPIGLTLVLLARISGVTMQTLIPFLIIVPPVMLLMLGVIVIAILASPVVAIGYAWKRASADSPRSAMGARRTGTSTYAPQTETSHQQLCRIPEPSPRKAS